MYTFICEDSPNGIFSGIYDAWEFKIAQNRQCKSAANDIPTASSRVCSQKDIHLIAGEPDNYQLFCEYIPVPPSHEKAQKVSRTLSEKLGIEFYETIMNAILAVAPGKKREPDKADAIYQTVVFALTSPAGAKVLDNLSEPYIHRVFTLARTSFCEAHHLTGFLRFSELENGVLFASIHPKNNALPTLAEHFTDRLPQEHFIIYDANRRMAAVHRAGKYFMLVDASDLNQKILNHYSEKEQQFRRLWLSFFENIAIESRINPALQAQNLPKRFWDDMLEFQGK